MSTVESALELLCHCADDHDGHPPAATCATVVKTGKYGRDPLPGLGYSRDTTTQVPATGTCRTCGRAGVKVVRVETRGLIGPALYRRKGESAHEFIVRRAQLKAEQKANPRGPLLQVGLVVAPHRTVARTGQPCAGGEPPAETCLKQGRRELDAWIAAYGPDARS